MTRRARVLTTIAVGVVLVAAAFGVAVLVADGESPSERALAHVVGAFRPAEAPFRGLTEVELGIGDRCFRVVVADSLQERVEGLRGRSDVGPYDGMLFVFPEPTTTPFTMSTVPVALEIGFYDADGAPVSHRTMQPCPDVESRCPLYSADGPYRYALETLSGGLPGGAISSCG